MVNVAEGRRDPMNATTTTIPATVQLRRSRLVGLMAASAALAALITWALLVFAVSSVSEPAQSADESRTMTAKEYDALRQMYASTHVEGTADRFHISPTSLSPQDWVNGDSRSRWVQGVLSATPEELAATFGH
jgi:hypothetical protein